MSIFAKHAASRKPIDVSGTFLELFFDVISDLTFGKSFDNLTTKQRSPIVADFLKGHKALGFFLINMPILHFVRGLRKLRNSKRDRDIWYDAALHARSKMQTNTFDIYTYLSQSSGFQNNTLSEAKLAVVAGADTNAITVANVCYLLCRYPEIQVKLYSELSDLPSLGGIIDDQYLVNKSYLTGIINETLRLYPPVPSGLQRLTPPQGAMIAGRYIPGNMNVTTPTYSLQRDPRAFVYPNDFIPERWSTQPKLILRKDAFIPFGYGAYSCAGKPLAMLQLRMVVAMVFKRFTVSFAPGKEAACCDFIENQADCFTLHLQPLPLVLEERRSSR
ncbi:CypX Cytochrome P450 [Pyrenophora tritici-repentis]|nr:CypX Cytochrome P450 [Pyrenophora tritici-repentis]KAI0626807.1 CypX Cytochrome P450 [Pyrenophora tritici-repentis]